MINLNKEYQLLIHQVKNGLLSKKTAKEEGIKIISELNKIKGV